MDSLVLAILEVAGCGELFSDGKPRYTGNFDDVEINIDFADGVFTDKTTQFTQDSQAVALGVLSKKRFLMRNYSLDEATAEKWLEESMTEQPEMPMSDYQEPGPREEPDNQQE